MIAKLYQTWQGADIFIETYSYIPDLNCLFIVDFLCVYLSRCDGNEKICPDNTRCSVRDGVNVCQSLQTVACTSNTDCAGGNLTSSSLYCDPKSKTCLPTYKSDTKAYKSRCREPHYTGMIYNALYLI